MLISIPKNMFISKILGPQVNLMLQVKKGNKIKRPEQNKRHDFLRNKRRITATTETRVGQYGISKTTQLR
jgi:hypothetical protein